MKYRCHCCGFATLTENPKDLTYEICPVCFWENDPLQNDTPNYSGGANAISLDKAKENYAIFGAVEERFVHIVRQPKEEEI